MPHGIEVSFRVSLILPDGMEDDVSAREGIWQRKLPFACVTGLSLSKQSHFMGMKADGTALLRAIRGAKGLCRTSMSDNSWSCM